MRRLLLVVCLAMAAMFALATAVAAQSPDTKASFLASNPNSGWEYGFVDENGEFVAYNSTFDDGQGIAGWCLDKCPGIFGDVTINYSSQAIDRYGCHWEPGQISLVAPSRGGSTVIRWHSPDGGEVVVDTLVTNTDEHNTTSLVVDGQAVTPSDTSQTMAASAKQDKPHTAKVKVKKHGVIDLVVSTPAGEESAHVGVSILITPVGSSQSKATSLGVRKKA